ncbi:MAG: cytochrome c oxidase subunit 4 [Acidimicrobiia bacterium]|nr:cytochrome c oxidase subunit 4 [Acidimicrobiia bacterium]
MSIQTPDNPERDDAGREDDSPGFDIQARLFGFIGGFLFVIATVYWLLTYEHAGSVMLLLAGALAMTVAAYLGWQKPPRSTSVDEAEDAGDEEPWFPAASGWPFALAIGIVLVANGLLLGLWLLLPAGAFLAYAVAGFILQSRVRG